MSNVIKVQSVKAIRGILLMSPTLNYPDLRLSAFTVSERSTNILFIYIYDFINMR